MGEAIERKKQETIDSINATARDVKKTRYKIIDVVEFAEEMNSEENVLADTSKDYINQILYYAKQRTFLKGRNESDIAQFNFSSGSTYNSIFNSDFSNNTPLIFGYEFINNKYEQVTYTYESTHRIAKIESEESPGDYKLVTGTEKPASDDDYIEFSISTRAYATNPSRPDYFLDIVEHTDSDVTIEPDIFDKIKVFNYIDGKYILIGFFEVQLEGLKFNSSFNPIDDSLSQSAYKDSIMEVDDSTFRALLPNSASTSYSSDDVAKSINNENDTTEPYTESKLNNNPMYPALNTTVLDTFSDKTSPYYDNWNFELDGTVIWGVYPKFKWEYKIKPDDWTTDATIEGSDYFIPDYNTVIASFSAGSLFPSFNFADNNYRFSNNILQVQDDSGEIPGSWVDCNCIWNEIAPRLSNVDDIITTITNIQTLGSRSNTIDGPFGDDNTFLSNVDTFLNDSATTSVISYYTKSDQSVTSVPSETIDTWNNFISALNIFKPQRDSRISTIESRIGNKSSGYIKDVYNSVKSLINYENGYFRDIQIQSEKLTKVLDITYNSRQYHNSLP